VLHMNRYNGRKLHFILIFVLPRVAGLYRL
jgi:hypothetical protein